MRGRVEKLMDSIFAFQNLSFGEPAPGVMESLGELADFAESSTIFGERRYQIIRRRGGVRYLRRVRRKGGRRRGGKTCRVKAFYRGPYRVPRHHVSGFTRKC